MAPRSVLRMLAIGALGWTATVPGASAQEPAQYLSIVELTVKIDGLLDFATYEQRLTEARRRIGYPHPVSVYQMASGGPVNRFHVVTPFDELSEMDGWPTIPGLLDQVYGESEGSRIYAEGVATLESVEYSVHVLQPDFSSGASRSWPANTMVQLVTTRVDAARSDDYTAFLAALKVAEDRAGLRRVRRTVTVGDQFTHTAVTQANNWSDIRADAAPPVVLREEYGESTSARLLAGANAAVLSRTIEVLRLREELSYQPN